MNTRTKRLADELERLIVQYGASDIELALAEVQARQAEKIDRVRSLVFALSSNSTATPASPPKRSKRGPKEVLESRIQALARSKNPQNKAVAEFITEVASREILPSAPELRDFAQDVGIHASGKKMDRSALTIRLANALAKTDPGTASVLIERGRSRRSEESSLQRWANVIVRDTK